MIVIADTSVILNLCRVQHEQLVLQLFGRVMVPMEVAAEFARLAMAGPRFAGLTLPSWIEICQVKSPVPAVVQAARLDVGETAAITLGLQLAVDALLIDEKLGRDVAGRLGLRTIGILGIALEARRRGLISSARALLERLEREAGFWVSSSLRQQVLKLAGE